jgi:drug/metabolite transporter (DMT)-like permease
MRLLIKDESVVSLDFRQTFVIWGLLFLYEIFSSTINHVLYLKGAKKVTASDSGIILLIEPVVGTVLAAIFLGQSITWNVVVGGALILVSNYIAIKEGD